MKSFSSFWLLLAAAAASVALGGSARSAQGNLSKGSSARWTSRQLLQTETLTASQLVHAAQGSSVSPERAIQLLLAAGQPSIVVNTSRELYEALRREEDVLNILLQGNVSLDDPVWGRGAPLNITAGKVVVLRSKLNTDSVDVRSSADAIKQAGAATLNFSNREVAIIVEGGGLLMFDGLILTGIAPRAAWLARKPPYPHGLGFNPSVICLPGCNIVWSRIFLNFNNADCSDANLEGIVFRVGAAVRNASAVTRLNATAYSVAGAHAQPIYLLSANGSNQDPGQVFVLEQDAIFNCNVDPTAQPQPQAAAAAPAPTAQPDAAGSRGGSSNGWVWAVVAIAAAAAVVAALATFLVLRRRQLRRRQRPQPLDAGSLPSAESPAAAGPPGDLALGRTSSPADKDLEKAIIPSDSELGALQQLRMAWTFRVGRVDGLRLLEPIGRGGFATVWKARWRGSFVSVKVIEHGMSAATVDGIQREAALSTSVSHPNVVATYKVATLGPDEILGLQQPHQGQGLQQEQQPGAHTEPALQPDSPKAAQPCRLEEGSPVEAVAAAAGAALESAGLHAVENSTAGSRSSAGSQGSWRFLPRISALLGSAGSRAGKGGRQADGPVMLSPPAGSTDGSSFAGAASQGPAVAVAPRATDAAAAAATSQLQHAGSALPEGFGSELGSVPSGLGATLIVQELCSRSVEDCMRDGQVLYWEDGSPDQVAILRMLIDAAQGLDYLAVSGIVHGDVKAANVLLSVVGGTRRGWQAKISDLGLSRMLPPDATSMAASADLGTAGYMAPEVIGEARLTKAADVYSFGILMYEVWTRRRAWDNLPLPQLVYAVVAQQQRPSVPADCPEGYASLMQQCWAAGPEDRPSFESVLRSLHALLKQLLAAGVPDSAGRRVQLTRPPVVGSLL